MILGERMSLTIDPSRVVMYGNYIYADETALATQRPLSFAGMIYVMGQRLMPDDEFTEYEVFWNHFTSEIQATISCHLDGSRTVVALAFFKEEEATAPDHVKALIEQRLQSLMEAFEEWKR